MLHLPHSYSHGVASPRWHLTFRRNTWNDACFNYSDLPWQWSTTLVTLNSIHLPFFHLEKLSEIVSEIDPLIKEIIEDSCSVCSGFIMFDVQNLHYFLQRWSWLLQRLGWLWSEYISQQNGLFETVMSSRSSLSTLCHYSLRSFLCFLPQSAHTSKCG